MPDTEELGWLLGLTVPRAEARQFRRVRTGTKPAAGWGTRINVPRFGVDRAKERLGLPLRLKKRLIDRYENPSELRLFLTEAEQSDADLLLCFDAATAHRDVSRGGHVVVFDRVLDGQIRVADPDGGVLRRISPSRLFDAMAAHGTGRWGGCWEIASA